MARDQGIRVTFVTGDVHCAAVGLFKTLVPGKKASPISPEQDYRYMLDVTTSELCHYSHRIKQTEVPPIRCDCEYTVSVEKRPHPPLAYVL